MSEHGMRPFVVRSYARESLTERVANEFRVYRRILTARVKADWQYRASFFSLVMAQLLFLGSDLAALVILVSLVERFAGWSAPQVLFLYGMSTVPFGIADTFIGMIERLADRYVRPGQFDVLLLRPSAALVQIAALEFELRRLTKLVPPVAAIIWAAPRLAIDWTVGALLLAVGALACGTVIYGSLWVIAASITFWAVASREATNSLTYGSQFANQYPLHVFPGWVRAVMGWVIPLAFVAYIPTVFIADASNPLGLPSWIRYSPPLVAALMAALAAVFWRLGLRHYQSTGS